MARVVWKGAITFGLVHVPVALYPASQDVGIDFDWLDKRSMDPVGYRRVNKRTGKEIKSTDIVKGIKLEDGDYVVLSEDEIKAAYPKSTQTIEIESFVKSSEIPFILLESPYYLEPIGKGEKVYALLRESMLDAGVIGIARVVMHSKEHLAALVPSGSALILNTIRWASEIRSTDELNLPAQGKTTTGLKPAELKMAAQLIRDMTSKWDPEAYSDKFGDAIRALVHKKVSSGETEAVTPLESTADASTSNIVDLTELLKKSLTRHAPATKAGDDAKAKPQVAKKAPAKASTKKRA